MSHPLLNVLRSVDEATARFQRETGLKCPSGCGACCENSRVETTPAQLLPLAEHLQRLGRVEETLARAQNALGAWCIFYEQRAPGEGRCGVYEFRPGICRLFGFAGVRKRGALELATCWRHRETQPDLVDAAEAAVTQGRVHMPVFDVEERRITKAHPDLAEKRMPLNEALAVALQSLL